MTKYDYYIKQVKPDDLKNFLRLSGGVGWKLIQIIIMQRIKPGLTLQQQPQMEILYECVMIRRCNGYPEDIEPEQEIDEQKTKGN